jgi:hypothetical protein
MRIALLSDIDAHWHAMTACLAHADRQRIDRRAFLCDMLGCGVSPTEVLEVLMAFAESGDVVLLGNDDEMAFSPPAKVERLGKPRPGGPMISSSHCTSSSCSPCR